jgi:hypothetical protein
VPIVKSIDNFETGPEAILDFRRQVAEAIIKNQNSKAFNHGGHGEHREN